MGIARYNTACPECRKKGRDKAGDNLVVYADDSCHCFACKYTERSKEYAELTAEDFEALEERKKEELLEKIQGKRITDAERDALKSITGFPEEYRAIGKDILQKYRVRFKFDPETGEPSAAYYPITHESELVGYKVRGLPKKFLPNVGVNNNQCEVFGKFLAKQCGTKAVVICGGENDAMAAFQMLEDANRKGYQPTLCVAPTNGESGAAKQIKADYEFFDRFDKIILALDNDPAGEEAAAKLIKELTKVLPASKIHLMDMKYKDCHEYLEKDDDSAFVYAFWNAKPYTPEGVYSSDMLYDAALEFVAQERIPLPEFMTEVNEMLCGGIVRGSLVMIAAGTSIGKTTIIDQTSAELIMQSKEKICVLSLEATAGQYSTNLISYASGIRFAKIKDKEERIARMRSKEAIDAANRLYKNEDGEQRLWVIDDRGAELEAVERRITTLVKSMGVTLLIIDVTSDLLDGLSLSEAQRHMSWQKKFAKETGVTIVEVVHLRKAANGSKSFSQGAIPTEDDLMGTSSLAKSASLIILLARDKMSDDPTIRNTTRVIIPKNRSIGETGDAGALYYLGTEHKLVNFREHFGLPFEEYLEDYKRQQEEAEYQDD